KIEKKEFNLDVMGIEVHAPYWDKTLEENEKVQLVVRPESIIPGEVEKGKLSGTVVNSVYFGSQILYEVQVSDDVILSIEVADPQQHKQYSVGTKVGLTFKEKSLHLLRS
ncbi:MAG: TOBE domain-containing protein, partial [bacterium]|nr:TOBE domain-containing protein [bacterium]